MGRRAVATVRALAAAIAVERCGAGDAPPERLARVTAAVLAQATRAPDVLRLPLVLLVHVFESAPLYRTGRPFHRLDPGARTAAVARWRESRLGALRSFVRYWESLVILAWYAEDESRGA